MYICIDFDGTIVDHRYPEIGLPAPHAIQFITEWAEKGAKLILFTMRSGDELKAAVEYLRGCGIYLYGINQNPDQSTWTDSPKAYGQVYVDDAAFGCPMVRPEGFVRPCVDWSVVGPAISRRLDF